MLITMSVMMTQPSPNKGILLPYMHPNIAQIARMFVVATLLTGRIITFPLCNTAPTDCFGSTIQPGSPSSLINWNVTTGDCNIPLVVSTSTSSAEQNSLAASTLLIAVEDPHPTRPNTMESILSYNPLPKTRRKRISRTTNKGTLSYIQARTIAHFLPVPNKHLTSSN
jgi:hypothetical protein